MNSLLVISFLNELELICFSTTTAFFFFYTFTWFQLLIQFRHTIKEFQALLFNTNNSIQLYSFVDKFSCLIFTSNLVIFPSVFTWRRVECTLIFQSLLFQDQQLKSMKNWITRMLGKSASIRFKAILWWKGNRTNWNLTHTIEHVSFL